VLNIERDLVHGPDRAAREHNAKDCGQSGRANAKHGASLSMMA
jgi:hypothetical protein